MSNAYHLAARGALLPSAVSAGALLLEVRRRLGSDYFWYPCVTFLCALQLALALSHDPWLDEWQALQIALQSPDLPALLENLAYEGHPPLWYFLLKGASLFVPALWALAAVQCLVAMTTQLVILLKSPFPRLERLLLSTSFFILFEYGTISRSLSLGVMLLFVFFAFRDRRIGWAATALLPMVDFQFGVLSIGALIILWIERRWSWVGFCAWALLGAAAALSVIPPADMIPALYFEANVAIRLGHLLNGFSALLLPLQTVENQLQWNGAMPFHIGVVGGPLFLLFSLKETRADLVHKLIFRAFLAITVAFTLFVYPLSIRHLSLVAILFILLTWRAAAQGVAPSRAFRIWLAAASACGLLSAGIAAVRPFDTAPEAAAFISKHGLERETWIAWPHSFGQGVSALTGMEFASFEKGCTQSFVRWNAPRLIHTAEDFFGHVERTRRRTGDFYLLTGTEIAEFGPIRRLASIEPGYDGQEFHLYAVRGRPSAKGEKPVPCAPRRLPLEP